MSVTVAGTGPRIEVDGTGAVVQVNVVVGGSGGGSGTVTSVTGTAPIAVASGTTTPVVSIAAATSGAAGSMSAADKAKLDGVASGATANATDAQLRDRATHTGTQAISTVTGLQAALDGKRRAWTVDHFGALGVGMGALATSLGLSWGDDHYLSQTPSGQYFTFKASEGDTLACFSFLDDSFASVPANETLWTLTGGVWVKNTAAGTVPSTGDLFTLNDYAAVDNGDPNSWTLGQIAVLVGDTEPHIEIANMQYVRASTARSTGVVAVTGSGDDYELGGVPIGTVLVNASSGNVTRTLMPNNHRGREVLYVKTDASANTVTITAGGAPTIKGASDPVVLERQWQSARFVFDGADWHHTDGALAAVATSGSATDLSTGTVATARLGSGTANSGTFLRGDGTWAAASAASPIIGGQGAGTQVNEPASATSLLTSTITVPVCAAGDLLMFDAAVSLLQNSGAGRTVSFTVRLGSTSILVASQAITTSASARSAHITGFIRVHSTTSQTGGMSVGVNVTAGGTGSISSTHGVATENLASTSTFDLLVTGTNNATQNYTLQSLSLRRIAA